MSKAEEELILKETLKTAKADTRRFRELEFRLKEYREKYPDSANNYWCRFLDEMLDERAMQVALSQERANKAKKEQDTL